MPDTHGAAGPLPAEFADHAAGREERSSLAVFVSDAESEKTLRDGLADAGCARFTLTRGGVRTAIAALEKSASPRALIVDVSGEADPVRALDALAAVVEPSIAVLVIGDKQDMDFYRELTRGIGAAEYLAKPLERDRVARLFGPVIRGQAYEVLPVTGGRSIAVTGASGGAGATTVAVNLAWHLAGSHRRHTCLVDADLHMGNAALMMDAPVGPGLHAALQAPDRVDAVFLERATELVAEDAVDGRQSLLAREAAVTDDLDYVPGAANTLLTAMRQRFNVVVVDAPFIAGPFGRDLMAGVTQRVLVLEPTLAAIRGALRLADLAEGPGQMRRPILVLNRLGRPGGLSRKQVEQTLGKPVDVVIPELPGKLIEAANLGKPLVTRNGPFRMGIEALAQQLSLFRTPETVGTPQRRRSDRSGFGRLLRR